jgi:hypothetical protein
MTTKPCRQGYFFFFLLLLPVSRNRRKANKNRKNTFDTWDRCYDFLKIFAKKFSKKLAFLTKKKLNYAKF